MSSIVKSAKTVDEAVQLALKELEISKEEVSIEILEQPSKGFLGFGSRPARVCVTQKEKPPVVKEKEIEKKEPKPKKVERKNKIEENNTESQPVEKKEEKSIEIDDARAEAAKNSANHFLRDVFNAMEIKAEIRLRMEDNILKIKVAGSKMGQLIGRRGQTLDALQYLTSLVINKGVGKEQYVKVVLDTEEYRAKREETLVRLAKRIAAQVSKTGKSVRLEPMNPYERRIIHAALQDYPGIVTFSEGEEPYRKVVISRSK